MGLDDLGVVGLVAAGGGLLGINHVGYMKSIIKHGIHPKVKLISGVSVGNLVLSAFTEARKPDDWPEICESICKRFEIIARRGPESVFDISIRRILTGAESAVDNARLVDLIKDLDPEKCANSPLHFEAAVISQHYGKKIVISNHSPIFRKYPELILKLFEGSAALSPFFAPVSLRLNGEEDLLSDGISISLKSAVRRCDTIFVLLPYRRVEMRRTPDRYRILSPMRIPIIKNFVDSYVIQHKEADDAVLSCALSRAKENGRPRIIPVYADNCPETVGPLDFSNSKDYLASCSLAEELMDKRLRAMGL